MYVYQICSLHDSNKKFICDRAGVIEVWRAVKDKCFALNVWSMENAARALPDWQWSPRFGWRRDAPMRSL